MKSLKKIRISESDLTNENALSELEQKALKGGLTISGGGDYVDCGKYCS